MRFFLAAVLLLVSSTALAEPSEEAFYGFGLGMFNSAIKSPAEVKVVNVGYRSHIISGIYWQFKGGVWGDSGGNGRKGGGYLSSGPGLTVDLKPFEIRSGWGLAAISHPDAYLGGHIPQFNGELYLGVRDRKGNGVGFQLEHISSAGIFEPNKGRDFLILVLSQMW
jgi:hypothetical protein